MKKTVVLIILLAAMAGGGLGVKAWRRFTAESQEERAFNRAELFLHQGRPIEALAIHQFHAGRGHSRFDWPGLEFRAVVAQVNLPRLTAIYLDQPDRVLASEVGSLTVARSFLHMRQPTEFEAIRTRWRGREVDRSGWLLLDADRLLLEGRAGEARTVLESTRLESTNDAPRLLRLALLSAKRNPAEAMGFLDQAASLAPRQPDARVLRGQVLEALGHTAEARVEYVAAVVAAPQNPLWRDQLGEHYRRTGALDLALATWREALPSPSLDAIWLKAAFWSRMLQPIDFASLGNTPPTGRLAPLVAVLQSQPPDRFVIPETLIDGPGGRRPGTDRPEVFWLQLADLLQRGDEAGALERLTGRDAAASAWAADLERGLLRVLSFRATGRLTPTGIGLPESPTPEAERHGLLAAMEKAAQGSGGGREDSLADDLAGILRGEHAFAAVFLASGWREAALRLTDPEKIPPTAPDWLVYGFAQALRFNRSPRAALAFLGPRAERPSLGLLRTEIRLALGERETALSDLEPLARLDNDVGFRAAWLLALDALDRKQPEKARHIVESQPRLADSITGRELLARTLLAEGRSDAATALYSELANRSVEARAFLARSAFSRQDWVGARRLTEELATVLPDSMELRANLEAIARAESGATP